MNGPEGRDPTVTFTSWKEVQIKIGALKSVGSTAPDVTLPGVRDD